MSSPFSGKAGRRAAMAVMDDLGKSQNEIDRRLLNGRKASIDTLSGGYTAARKLNDKAIAQFDPYATTGLKAFDQYADATGVNGQEGYDRAEGNFRASPGYDWQVDRATDAVARKASSLGALGSGNTMTAITDRASHLADQEYDDYLTRLDGIGKMGFAADTAQAGLYQTRADMRTRLGQDKSNVIQNFANMSTNTFQNTAMARAEALKGGMLAGQNAAANRWGAGMSLLSTLAGFAGSSTGGKLLGLA
jgi:hypothetical protein